MEVGATVKVIHVMKRVKATSCVGRLGCIDAKLVN